MNEPASRFPSTPSLSGFKEPSLSFTRARSIKREIVAQLQTSWQEGQPLQPEELLARWPDDPRQDGDVAQLLFEDFCARLRHGDEPSLADYQGRFPEHRNSLANLMHTQDFMASVSPKSGSSGAGLRLPTIHEEVFGFRLKHELGHGAFARVFLAEQVNLAGRPVVLKVSAIIGNEPETLAQLQHTNIVPIYSLHDDERAGLRAVCMPYFGGATLSDLMRAVWTDGKKPTQGEQIVQYLEKLPSAGQLMEIEKAAPATAISSTALPLLRGASYVRAAGWIGARLAEGLQHAHERGVYHRDIKPSNILIASDGQPMLLDFNLAHQLHGTAAQATLGGTVAYMAPEHLRALTSPDPNSSKQVDQRSDIFSLGLVLYEMLLGRGPFDHNASYTPMRTLVVAMEAERAKGLPSRQRFGATIPLSLESIVRKCLAPDPRERYQLAEHLAEDLRRFLDDRPLQYAPELSWRERGAKWMRRHPRLTSSSSVAGIAAVLLLTAAAALVGGNELLQTAQARERKQAFEAGAVRALCLVNTTAELQNHLEQGLPVCTETLALYEVLERDDWQHRPAWRRLAEDDRQRLGDDVRELLILLAWARVQTSPGDQAVVTGALALLDRAEVIDELPPSPALWRDRAHYYGILKQADQARRATERAEQLQPASARDFYLLATSYARHKSRAGYTRAIVELDRALALNPRHYWSLVQRGICYQELGASALAAAEFGQCIGLRPDFAWGYFNRGCVLDHAGNKAEAIRDYTAALERDQTFLLAYVNRGLAFLDRKEYARALADFHKARDLGRDDAFLHAGMAMALEGMGRHDDADKAFADAFTRIAGVSEQVESRIRLGHCFAVSARLPEKAWSAFDAVLKKDPKQPQAIYGQAMLLVEQAQPKGRDLQGPEDGKKLTQALQLFQRAIDANPHFTDARRFRAVVFARQGQWQQAYQDIDFCLAAEPKSGPTLYAAACVAALTAKAGDPATTERAVQQSLALLEQAFQQPYGRDQAATDPDLAALRNHPQFLQLLENRE